MVAAAFATLLSSLPTQAAITGGRVLGCPASSSAFNVMPGSTYNFKRLTIPLNGSRQPLSTERAIATSVNGIRYYGPVPTSIAATGLVGAQSVPTGVENLKMSLNVVVWADNGGFLFRARAEKAPVGSPATDGTYSLSAMLPPASLTNVRTAFVYIDVPFQGWGPTPTGPSVVGGAVAAMAHAPYCVALNAYAY